MNEITYKGFTITATAIDLHDGNGWSTDIWIETHGKKEHKGRNFNISNSLLMFQTEEQAIEYCFQFGRDIIDGNVEGLTVEDL